MIDGEPTATMNSFAEYDLIIFDFHRTLTDAVYFDQFDRHTRESISNLIFRPPANEYWEHRWMTGKISCTDVLRHLAEELKTDPAHLEEVLYSGLQDIQWNQDVWDFSQTVRKITRTAIATINTDLFSRFIVPRYDLTGMFDVVVNSFDTGEISKTDICIRAATELGMRLPPHRILLIDDKPGNIDEFISAGGEGCLYRNDGSFGTWLQQRV